MPNSRAVDLRHDYGDDATLLANFLSSPYPGLHARAAIMLLGMAVRADYAGPVVIEDAVEVLSGAIASVAPPDRRSRELAIHWANRCATLAHLSCRSFARWKVKDPGRPYEVECLRALSEAADAVLGENG